LLADSFPRFQERFRVPAIGITGSNNGKVDYYSVIRGKRCEWT
jgi:hypothetical protein